MLAFFKLYMEIEYKILKEEMEMKRQATIGLAVAGITTIGSAIAALVMSGKNKKQLDKVEIKEDINQEVNDKNGHNEEIKNNDEEIKQEEEQLNIDDTDIEV